MSKLKHVKTQSGCDSSSPSIGVRSVFRFVWDDGDGPGSEVRIQVSPAAVVSSGARYRSSGTVERFPASTSYSCSPFSSAAPSSSVFCRDKLDLFPCRKDGGGAR